MNVHPHQEHLTSLQLLLQRKTNQTWAHFRAGHRARICSVTEQHLLLLVSNPYIALSFSYKSLSPIWELYRGFHVPLSE